MIDHATHPYYNYYHVENSTYTGKIPALMHSSLIEKRNSQKAKGSKDDNADFVWRLHNFETELEKNNLLTEPLDSLKTLYLQRVAQLRDEYDYLILNYSGGPDSHNILETFMTNNIFLDEIFIYSYFDENTIAKLQNSDPETFLMFPEFYEAERSALPLAKYFVENYSPHTKITHVNDFYQSHRYWWLSQTEKSLNKNINGNAAIMLTHRHMPRSVNPNFIKEWKDIKQKKKTAHIWGIEKPKLSYDDHGIFFALSDSTIQSRIDLNHLLTYEDVPNNHELFYIHPKFIKMFIKQAHVINRSLDIKTLLNTNKNFVSTRANENALAKALYQHKIPIPYHGLKGSDLLPCYKDFEFLRKMSQTGIIPGYADMVETLNMKLYYDNPTDDVTKKYDNFVDFIHTNFLSNLSKKEMLYKLALGTSTKKYYIQIHNGV